MNAQLILQPIIALRQRMGAEFKEIQIEFNKNALSAEELKLIETQGIEVALEQIQVAADSTFVYKNRRVLIYIRDVSPLYRENDINSTLPRFHLCNCEAYKKMVANNRKFRYVVSSRDDGVFMLNFFTFRGSEKVQTRSEERRLEVCMYCLRKLSWQNINACSQEQRNHIRATFSLKEFFKLYPKNLLDTSEHLSDKIAPLNTYSDNWDEISRKIRQAANWRCQKCGLDCSAQKELLHVHHKNGQKNDNTASNLIALCKSCHAKEPYHEHLQSQ